MDLTCSNCGRPNPADKKFCSNCGAPLAFAAPVATSLLPLPPAQPVPGPAPTPPSPSGSSILASLAALGIRVTRRQIVGIIAGALTGLIVAWLLPYLYAPIFGRVLDIVAGSNIALRDNFNKFVMTGTTCLVSFGVSLVITIPSKLLLRARR